MAASASSSVVMLSPSWSRVSSIPLAWIAFAASMASSALSPAMKRRAKLVGVAMPMREAIRSMGVLRARAWKNDLERASSMRAS